MTSNLSWKIACRTVLQRHEGARVAVVGLGNDLFGDDGVGLLVVRALKTELAPAGNRLLVEGGTAPENYAGQVRRFAPALVVFIDAVAMQLAPGAVRVLRADDIAVANFPTHSTSITLLFDYLAHDAPCEIVTIGVQPGTMAFDAPVSPVCAQAAHDLAGVFMEQWRSP